MKAIDFGSQGKMLQPDVRCLIFGQESVGGGSPSVYDEFNGTDADDFDGRASDSGQVWTGDVGDFVIASNETSATLRNIGSNPNLRRATLDAGAHDGVLTLSCQYGAIGSGNIYMHALFRYTDSDNYWYVVTRRSGSNQRTSLARSQSGSNTTIDVVDTTGLTSGDPFDFVVTLSGSSITVATHGETLSTTDSFNATATGIGLGGFYLGSFKFGLFDRLEFAPA